MADSPEKSMAANRQKYLTNPGSVTRFPSEEIPYKMLLNFKEYSYLASQGNMVDSGSNAKQLDGGSVILPLPLQLNDTTSISAETISSGLAAGLSGFSNPMQGIQELLNSISGAVDGGANAQAYSKILTEAGTALGGAASQLNVKGGLGQAIKLAGVVSGSAIGAAGVIAGSDTGSLLSGRVANSFDTMQFKGVKLKQHSFNWRLSPSSANDSEKLRTIINKIKMNILPSYVAGVVGPAQFATHALLKYPKIAFVSFYGIDQDYYYKLRPCMITSFSVRYNAGEQLNIYKGGKPAVVDMSMDLTELTSHSSEDYGGDNEIAAANYTNAMNDVLDNIKASRVQVKVGTGRGGQ
jgi:hypothetical protein